MKDWRAGCPQRLKRRRNNRLHLVWRQRAARAGDADRLEILEAAQDLGRGHVDEQHALESRLREALERIRRAREIVAVEGDERFQRHGHTAALGTKASSASLSAGWLLA